jgi:hypothetical protein
MVPVKNKTQYIVPLLRWCTKQTLSDCSQRISGWLESGLRLMDALHFHRRMKNLSYAGRKIGAAGGTGEHPSLHVAFDEWTFVLRSEQTQH